MGSEAHVVVVDGSPDLLAAARRRIDELEARWSRFRTGSEVARLEEGSGRAVTVSEETFLLVERAVEAWHLTGGRFDPTVLGALRAAGYDRPFTELPPDRDSPPRSGPAPAAAGGRIELDAAARRVRLPAGLGFDPGGIGKGLAADLVSAELRRAGAAGVLVSLGGDLRARGRAPDPRGWVVGVEDPDHPDRDLLRLSVPEGAVATSSRRRRTWRIAGQEHHHLIDPATGRPAHRDVAAATVVGGAAWWCEALATAAVVAGVSAGRDLLAERGATGVLVDTSGRTHRVGDLR